MGQGAIRTQSPSAVGAGRLRPEPLRLSTDRAVDLMEAETRRFHEVAGAL
jgi:hypothetical protein